MRARLGRLALSAALLLAALLPIASAAADEPSGQVVIAWHVTISPSWFDPSTAPPQITPFGMLYAIHDALVRPIPGRRWARASPDHGPKAPTGWFTSSRPNLHFHNGDPLTTEDVKFGFDRYKGAAASILHQHVKEVEIVDPQIVRFHLDKPWPDFMTFFGTTASAAGIVLPKKYLTEVGDDGFKQHVGAGPYKFVSNNPGIEIVLEAYLTYWRRVPNVKTLVMRSVPDATTRALMLKTGEPTSPTRSDGPDAEGLQETKGIRIVATKHASIFWIEFFKQWDEKSPWHDIRLPASVLNYALDRKGINHAACLDYCPPAR